MTRADVNRKLKKMGAVQWQLAECMSIHRQTLAQWMAASEIRKDHRIEIEAGLIMLESQLKLKERELSDGE